MTKYAGFELVIEEYGAVWRDLKTKQTYEVHLQNSDYYKIVVQTGGPNAIEDAKKQLEAILGKDRVFKKDFDSRFEDFLK